MNIALFIDEHLRRWDQSSTHFPFFTDVISLEEKIVREGKTEDFARIMQSSTEMKKPSGIEDEKYKTAIRRKMKEFFINTFNFTDKEFSIISQRGFMGVTREFMQMARKFDPGVSVDDIFQASRNLWIVNSLQIMLNQPVRLTPSVFAYSMLYPYTDNYLDNPKVTSAEKVTFSNRFRKRLIGENVLAANEYERIIFDLVILIESEWNRQKYPRLYESLLAIHDAQTKSIELMNREHKPGCRDLLSICIEKGGTSVLADGYLVNGRLTPEQEQFCFGFGVFLQFVDDIQDISEDIEGGLETVFTYASFKGLLEEYTNRSFSYIESVLAEMNCFPETDQPAMYGLMHKSIFFLINEAIGKNAEYWPENFVTRFERYSPLRYSFIKKRRGSMASNRISLMKKMEEFIFSENGKTQAAIV